MEPIRKVIHEIRERYGEDNLRAFAESIGGHDTDDESMIRTIWANMMADALALFLSDHRQMEDQMNQGLPP